MLTNQPLSEREIQQIERTNFIAGATKGIGAISLIQACQIADEKYPLTAPKANAFDLPEVREAFRFTV